MKVFRRSTSGELASGELAFWGNYIGPIAVGTAVYAINSGVKTSKRNFRFDVEAPQKRRRPSKNSLLIQEFSGDPNPHYFLESTAVQMGGVLPYKWEVYCWVSLLSRLRRQNGTAIQMGGAPPYKLEVYCSTFFEASRGWGFWNSFDLFM